MEDKLVTWWEKAISYGIGSIYLFNILTMSFLALFLTSSPAFADLPLPVSLQYSCPTGWSYSNGTCVKYTYAAPVVTCPTAGYSVTTVDGLQTCAKNESRTTINSCPTGTNWLDIQQSWNYQDPLYPNYCSARQSASSLANCPSGYTTYSNGICFKLQTPLGKTCPNEGGASEKVEQICPQTYVDLGLCKKDETVTVSLPDQSWQKQNESTCKRTLYEGTVSTCPTGYTPAGDDNCVKVQTTPSTVSCPSGYYQDGGQCSPGTAPSCPAGTSYKNGSCVSTSGTVTSCPAGKELDPYSNTCITAKGNLSDPDYFMQMGRDFGKSAVGAIELPGGTTNNIKLNYRNVGQTDMTTSNMTNADMLGLDSNNGYNVSATGTYQDEKAQQKSIKEAVERNTAYGKSEPVVGANQDETNDAQDHSANAYLTLLDAQNKNPPHTIGKDASFLKSGSQEQQNILNGSGGQFFGDCSTDTVTKTTIDDSLVKNTIQECFKPNRNNLSSCNRERILTPPNENKIFGSGFGYCGKRCISIILGDETNNALPDNEDGTCKVYRNATSFRLLDGINIVSATIGKSRYDDYFKLSVNDTILNQSSTFPLDGQSCSDVGNTIAATPIDVTVPFQKALAKNRTLTVEQMLSVKHLGEGYTSITLNFDQDLLANWVEDIVESPEGCEASLSTPDSFCTASDWKCDARLDSELINNGGVLNLSDIEGAPGVQAVSGANDVVLMVMRRDFEPSLANGTNSNCGNIVGTTDSEGDNKNDDGLWVCKEGIGFQTHSIYSGPGMYGTEFVNVLPKRNKWSVFAVKINNGLTSRFYNENGQIFNAKRMYGGSFDSLKQRRIIIGRGNTSQDWTKRANAPLYLAHWEVLRDITSDQQVLDALEKTKDMFALVNLDPLYEGDDGLTPCMYAHMEDYVCDPLKGNRLPLNGGSVGYSDIRTMGDQCTQYTSDEKCSIESSTCAEGWLDSATNTCFGWDVTYRCESGSVITKTETVENNTCFTDASCVDGNCETKAKETNTDFVQTAAMYAAINELDNGSSCTDPTNPDTCQVFVGSVEQCSWDQLKVNDCCSTKGTDTTSNLFKLSLMTFKAGQNAVSSENAWVNEYLGGEYAKKGWSMVKSGWNDAVDWVSDSTKPATEAAKGAWDYLGKSFSSEATATAGNATTTVSGEAGSVVTDFFTDLATSIDTVKTQIYQWVYDVMPQAMQEAIVSGAEALGVEVAKEQSGALAEGAGAQAMEGVVSNLIAALSFVMMLYTIYNMLKLLYTILTACDEEELKMGTELKERKCFFVRKVPCKKTLGICTDKAHNEYCCFKSTLARIIMEQVIVQLGHNPVSWHDNEMCRGLTLDELSNIDLGKVDFSEWVGLMTESGMFPEPDMEKTGEDAIVNPDARDSADDRIKNQLGVDTGVKVREAFENASPATNLDCSGFPRPPSCPI